MSRMQQRQAMSAPNDEDDNSSIGEIDREDNFDADEVMHILFDELEEACKKHVETKANETYKKKLDVLNILDELVEEIDTCSSLLGTIRKGIGMCPSEFLCGYMDSTIRLKIIEHAAERLGRSSGACIELHSRVSAAVEDLTRRKDSEQSTSAHAGKGIPGTMSGSVPKRF